MSATERHELLDGLRAISRPRVRACRRKRIAPTVQIQRRPDGGVSRVGVLACGSVWACPVCAPKIYLGRADEIKTAIQGWRGVVLLVTATVRHGLGSELKTMRQAEAKVWSGLWEGRKGKARRKAWTLHHTIRGLEVTHGAANGWHPHLHTLLFVDRDPDEETIDELKLAWCLKIARKLGAEHAPSFEIGIDVRRCTAGEYLTKLGLEVASIGTKQGKAKRSRTPWQIAKDAAAGDEPSKLLWQTYTRDFLGARQLCWSKGAKRALGVLERSDQELAEEEVLGVGHVLAEWSGKDWDACARAFPLWSSMIERATEHALAVDELNRLPMARAQSPPGVIRPYVPRKFA